MAESVPANGFQLGSEADQRRCPAVPRLSISVLGGLFIKLNRHELSLANRKARGLLAYLALNEAHCERREHLAGLLWPDASEHNARASLRQVLLDIRQALGPGACGVVISGRNEVELIGDVIELDLSVIFNEIAVGRVPKDLLSRARAAETLLSGYEDLSPMMRDWVLALRAQVHQQMVRVLERGYEDTRFPRRQRRLLAEALLLLDPLHEGACRAVMRLAAEDGEIGSALRAYADLYNALDDELDMEPSAATRALVAEIKQGRFDTVPAEDHSDVATASSPSPAMPKTGAPVVAVLPFRSLGPDQPPRYIAEGIVEDTVRMLTALQEPVVISSNSTRGFRNEIDLQQIGHILDAGYVVSGTLRSAFGQLRLTVELAETSGGTVLWSNAYDAMEPVFFDVQDDLASSIARTLVPRLRDAELRRSRGQRPEDLTAYHLMLRARELVFRLERPAFEEAGSILREALDRDPGYAPLYAAAADWYSIRIGQGWSSDPDADMRALEAVARSAISMDSGNGRALALLAHNRTIFQREYDAALTLIERALEASPNDAEALMWSSPTLSYIGETDEALRRAERAIALSPQDPFMFRYEHFVCIAYYAAGAYDDAAYWGMRSLRANPHYTSNLRMTAAALVGTGRADEAAALARKVLELDPGFRIAPMIERQAFRDDARRQQYGRHLAEAGLPP